MVSLPQAVLWVISVLTTACLLTLFFPRENWNKNNKNKNNKNLTLSNLSYIVTLFVKRCIIKLIIHKEREYKRS